MRSLLGPRTLGVVLFLSGHAAMAQTRPYPECTAEPTEGDIAAAKGAFQAGQASFNEADYDRAITYWEDAYRRDCTAHALLLNLARAYELKGDKAQAVEALQTFLARKPESPQKDQIERRIVVLNQQIAAEAPTTASPSAEAQPPQQPPAEPAEAAPTSAEAAATAKPA
ncbi:MAG TPA: tetratricopeptide repeat protein, partial [Polyangiaceae bacterium]